jgi:hypothetical protein
LAHLPQNTPIFGLNEHSLSDILYSCKIIQKYRKMELKMSVFKRRTIIHNKPCDENKLLSSDKVLKLLNSNSTRLVEQNTPYNGDSAYETFISQ